MVGHNQRGPQKQHQSCNHSNNSNNSNYRHSNCQISHFTTPLNSIQSYQVKTQMRSSTPAAITIDQCTFHLDDRINKSNLVRGQVYPLGNSTPIPILAHVVEADEVSEFLTKKGTVLQILHNKPHPGFLKMRKTIESATRNFIVVDGPDIDLASHIRCRGWLSEYDSLKLFRQLVSAVAHLHKHRIVLKRLRLEHVFFAIDHNNNNNHHNAHGHNQNHNTIVIGDIFGAGAVHVQNDSNFDGRDTPGVYALGMALFSMLSGRQYRQQFSIETDIPQALSKPTQQLLTQLLDRDPHIRPNTTQILEILAQHQITRTTTITTNPTSTASSAVSPSTIMSYPTTTTTSTSEMRRSSSDSLSPTPPPSQSQSQCSITSTGDICYNLQNRPIAPSFSSSSIPPCCQPPTCCVVDNEFNQVVPDFALTQTQSPSPCTASCRQQHRHHYRRTKSKSKSKSNSKSKSKSKSESSHYHHHHHNHCHQGKIASISSTSSARKRSSNESVVSLECAIQFAEHRQQQQHRLFSESPHQQPQQPQPPPQQQQQPPPPPPLLQCHVTQNVVGKCLALLAELEQENSLSFPKPTHNRSCSPPVSPLTSTSTPITIPELQQQEQMLLHRHELLQQQLQRQQFQLNLQHRYDSLQHNQLTQEMKADNEDPDQFELAMSPSELSR